MSVLSTSAMRAAVFLRSDAVSGRNPTMRKDDVSMPLSTSALTQAHAPEITVYSSPSSMSALTSILPGSDMSGMPASDTSATSLPSFSLEIIPSTAARSENL